MKKDKNVPIPLKYHLCSQEIIIDQHTKKIDLALYGLMVRKYENKGYHKT